MCSGERLTHVALLRGINVGGKNKLAMKDLLKIFAEAGCKNTCTYIQSGNVLFNGGAGVVKTLPQRISSRIADCFAYRVPVIVRTRDELDRVIRDNPFLKARKPESGLHVYFLADKPGASAIASLDPDRFSPDEFHVLNREVYLHLPNGMGRTKLTNAYFDSKLATTSTARNWATVLKLSEMMRG